MRARVVMNYNFQGGKHSQIYSSPDKIVQYQVYELTRWEMKEGSKDGKVKMLTWLSFPYPNTLTGVP